MFEVLRCLSKLLLTSDQTCLLPREQGPAVLLVSLAVIHDINYFGASRALGWELSFDVTFLRGIANLLKPRERNCS